MIDKLDGVQRDALRAQIEDAMRQGGLTNGDVASDAQVDESTVRNVRAGKTRVYATIEKVCSALGIAMDEVLERTRAERSFSPSLLGGYRLPIFSLCVGSFTTIRPQVGDGAGKIERYRTDIWWDDKSSCLSFRESSDRGEAGQLYIPPSSAFLYLMTIRDGYVRTVVASTMHNKDREMYGMEMSQIKTNDKSNNYVPALRPIVFIKKDNPQSAPRNISSDDTEYEEFAKLLQKASGYVENIRL